MAKPSIIVAHFGARLHYAVAQLLHDSDHLAHFYTDFFLPEGSFQKQTVEWVQQFVPSSLLKKLNTRTASIPSEKVTAFPGLGLQYYRNLQCDHSTDVFYEFNRQFAQKVSRHKHFGKGDAIYGFTGSALELFEKAQSNGQQCILEQMSAPVSTVNRVISAEMERWPGWQTEHLTLWDIAKWAPREKREWELADVIIAPSAFIKKELENSGVKSSKIRMIPFAVSTQKFPQTIHQCTSSRKLRILYVGALRLLKGIPYLLKALRELPQHTYEAILVGQNHFNRKVLANLPAAIILKDQVPRDKLAELYQWADIFVMPSLCEGSATVNYEARACGLPAIATFTSGTWIENNREGIVVEPGNPEELADAIRYFINHPEVVETFSRSNIDNLHNYTWQAYKKRIVDLIQSL